MLLRELLIVLLVLTAVSSSDAQDATTILRNTLQKYKDLTTYHVEGTQETTVTDDMQHKWERQNFVLAKAPGKHYHYDIKTPDIWNIVVADGATEWEFQPWVNEYSRRSVPELNALPNGPGDEIRAFMAQQARVHVDALSGERIEREHFA